ncbi:MAG TPA: SDR family NAD(P)-dependent oxidoreductase [Pyrinomonadaceae bacterium]|nr:SDR family NAD(P)-dependent oxidoreductase [Pyrinomonadaceae bacterium]
MDWSHKVVLITGASSGIGRGLALELARRGARLGLLARGVEDTHLASAAGVSGAVLSRTVIEPSPRLLEVVDEIRRETTAGKADSQRTIALAADVRDAASVRAAADRLRSEFGRIDVLIANAGIGATTDAAELNPEDVSRVLNVNVIGAVNSVAAVLPEMIQQGSGQLVAISSLAAYRGLRKSAAYCASKASVSAFFESVRIDLLDRGIDVSIIHPGFIKTPLTAGRQAQMPFLMELDDAVKKIIRAIEQHKKSYAFPWQLATIVRAGMIMPNFMYDWISRRNSFRE